MNTSISEGETFMVWGKRCSCCIDQKNMFEVLKSFNISSFRVIFNPTKSVTCRCNFFNMSCKDAGFKEKQHTRAHTHTLIISIISTWNPKQPFFKWLFQLGDSKSLHRKWLFHQTSIYKWLALGLQGPILDDIPPRYPPVTS